MRQRVVSLGSIKLSNELPFALISGPCVIESRDHVLMIADQLSKITQRLNIPLIFKSSFDKANRTSIHGFRGIGMDESLKIFQEIKDNFGCPVLTDVHESEQCQVVAQVVDVLQIPAFLCRQTDLLVAAGKTGKVLNVKKGQFLAPWDTVNIVKKVDETGNLNTMLCERGVSFGYNTLVNDMRALPIMAGTGCPVIFDATHSVQQPGGAGASTSGDRRFVPILARAAVAVGVAGVFMETHDNPDQALSDGPNMIHLKDMENLLKILKDMDSIAKANMLFVNEKDSKA
jgi:2-dehydro-3-deoxyphosphooctonate aldolase (KDO 8-P synthase)